MLSKKEKYIIRIIRFFPFFLIFAIAIIGMYLFLVEHERHYYKEITNLKSKFINREKQRIKNEVNRVYEYIQFHKQNSENRLKKLIKYQVYEAHSVMQGLYNEYKNQKSKEEIIHMMKAALQEMRFLDGRGYFYIYDMKGNNIFHPIMKSLEGRSLWNYKDITGKSIIQEGIKALKLKNEIYDDWYWEEPKSKKIKRKIGFHKIFEPYNIFVGTGEYTQEYEKELKSYILRYISKIKYLDKKIISVIDYDGILLTSRNKKNQKTYKQLLNIAKSKNHQGFFSYVNNKDEYEEKITFVKGFDHWQWAIYASFHKDSLKKELDLRLETLEKEDKETIKSFLFLCAVLTIIMLAISFYVIKLLEKSFYEYREKILEEAQKNRQKDTILAQQSKMAAMGEMIANITHQWRQPLSVISTAVTGLKFEKEMDILKDDNFYRGMDSIHNSVMHLSKTIDDFRNFFKPNKDKINFNLKDVVEKTLKLLSSQFDINNIYFIKNCENIKIHGAENELVQVLINIINNSKDALKNTDNKRLIFIDVFKQDNKVILLIKDTAGGINKSIINKVFEPYFTTKKDKGTGIGLYMSKQIIADSLNGEIAVSNETFVHENIQYKGACFKLTFDLVD
ncbi:Cache sensor-containing signal transduction histidine kinase [Malaciobacter marinus]|uniref:histidine kinase n=1 Tax=Malaciobacter marinus TaxID=505249 RepID=A0A347TH57_9BACT|nr:cache domain-containing protein [Malaciobacter marinus]AXX85935.1 Cache sensor-containing signal transduction histidine kinase [Malaciobacter marinus]PHO15378.1 histidine kinase [Malaciobacter marinus]